MGSHFTTLQPLAANRILAYSGAQQDLCAVKSNSKEEAIKEAEKLNLRGNHFYFVLLGELYTGIDNIKAKQNFQTALSLARTITDKQTIQRKWKDL